MQRKVQITSDGSHTIAIPDWTVTYHSHHGAVLESTHVFIEAGLDYVYELFPDQMIHVLEIGFGTGLNALLSWQQAMQHQIGIYYTAMENAPLTMEEVLQINHGEILSLQNEFLEIHRCAWEKPILLHKMFVLDKKNICLPTAITTAPVHCIYFDAFAPAIQPELWSQSMFAELYKCLIPGGVLVTYSSKAEVRRAMVAAGFSVTKIPGPFGKREMVRATKG